jgi:hypothetical protein
MGGSDDFPVEAGLTRRSASENAGSSSGYPPLLVVGEGQRSTCNNDRFGKNVSTGLVISRRRARRWTPIGSARGSTSKPSPPATRRSRRPLAPRPDGIRDAFPTGLGLAKARRRDRPHGSESTHAGPCAPARGSKDGSQDFCRLIIAAGTTIPMLVLGGVCRERLAVNAAAAGRSGPVFSKTAQAFGQLSTSRHPRGPEAWAGKRTSNA